MKKSALLALPLALVMALSACGGESAAAPSPEVSAHTPAPTPTPTVPPSLSPSPHPLPEELNPLTGEPLAEAWRGKRPVAVMLNNLHLAMPQQGNSQADIIYECMAEGGITRMMGIYTDLDGLDTIGSIRSARPYYLELALGHDAIFVHCGGSEEAYADIPAWGVDNLDGVRGPYLSASGTHNNLMWRDPERRAAMSLEHTVVTDGEALTTYIPATMRRDLAEGFDAGLTFVDDGTPAEGETANSVVFDYSNYKTARFTYDADSGKYLVGQYNGPYIDGNTGEQIAMTNVLILKTPCRATGDSLGHVNVDVVGEGDGYFACGGKLVSIHWSKASRNEPLRYTLADGTALALGRGKSYIAFAPTEVEVHYE